MNQEVQEVKESFQSLTDKLEGWSDSLIRNLPNIGVALVVLIISYFISRSVYKLTFKISKRQIKQVSIAQLVSRAVSIIIVLMGLFLALGALNLGRALTGLLTGAGISGLAIGLALQGTLSNTISGIVLSFRKNVRIGDWIETNGYAGEIIDINVNYFVLKEADNNMTVLPNKVILENPFKNYSLTRKMRITVDCGVSYDSDLEKVEQVVKETVAKFYNQKEIGKEVEFYYKEFGESSINFIVRFWADAENSLQSLKIKSKIIIEIKKAFDKEGFNIPFPIRTLQFEKKLSARHKQDVPNKSSVRT
ncbi:small conductance mechanosensitive channel [Tenacibaculum adriaticum]|uniref:Small conductance mechanosensitive channel n=1 Tax=Tenacibaculum adriaticum TaxID=413713 RepID=A0A5S5DQL0_9FLAO|nr:mechanosensitive ion channel family protein [Tenacibaculum adriaticum]TYP98167.1 small conductance mechanosensitive channel [Tenacibaculum adriaticum]